MISNVWDKSAIGQLAEEKGSKVKAKDFYWDVVDRGFASEDCFISRDEYVERLVNPRLIFTTSWRILGGPPLSSWRARICGNMYYIPNLGNHPNAFHRFMQKLCFGVVWERIKQ